MALDYLEFDYSEDEEGTGTWDAMASVKAERVPALAAEIEALLRWASQKFAGRQGAVEEGFDWDAFLIDYINQTRQTEVES